MEKVDEIRDNVRKEYPGIPEEDIDLHFDQQTQAIVFEKAFGHRNMNEIRGMGLVGSYGLSQGPDKSCTSRSQRAALVDIAVEEARKAKEEARKANEEARKAKEENIQIMARLQQCEQFLFTKFGVCQPAVPPQEQPNDDDHDDGGIDSIDITP